MNRWWLAMIAALAVTAFALWAPRPASAAGTGTIAVCITDSSGANLVPNGDQAWYAIGGTSWYVGSVGPSGCRESTLTAGTNVKVWVGIKGTFSQKLMGTVPDGSTLRFDFYTTKVSLDYDHAIAFGGPAGDLGWFTKPSMELLSDGVTPVHFRLDSTGGAPARTSLLWPIATGTGAEFHRSLFVARLIDHAGNPLAGGTVGYYLGGWHHNVATTDATGNAVFALSPHQPSISVQMWYNGTDNQKGPSTASNFTFQTALAVVKLHDADGNPLDTGSASYYALSWRSIGNTSGGETSAEVLPGSHSFAMTYNNTRQQKDGVAIAWPSTDVIFQTGRLTAYYSGTMSWNNSQFYPFVAPTMEFLPGSIRLNPAGCQTDWIAIAAGDHLVKSVIVATLANSANQPLAGGVATVYASGWKPVGTTGGNGKTCGVVDGALGNATVAMTYGGTRQQITQHQPTNSVYAFKTTGVTVELRNSSNTLIDTGNASYYASGWHTIGDTSGGKVVVQMLPGSYSFAMTFNGTRQQLNSQAISGVNDTVTFKTTGVTVELRDSGNALIDTGSASYYASGWRTIGNTSGGVATVEMLPGSYSFAMTFNGTRQQLNSQVVSGLSSTVTFQTTAVTVELRNSSGALIDTGNAWYYASGWRTIGNTSGGTVVVQMLPGSYSFAMTYLGTRHQLNGQVISGNTDTVTFQTGSVHSGTNTAVSYYASGWRPFTQDMELLPGSYTFDFSDATPNAVIPLSAGVVNNIH